MSPLYDALVWINSRRRHHNTYHSSTPPPLLAWMTGQGHYQGIVYSATVATSGSHIMSVDTVQHSATQCNTVQHSETQWNTVKHSLTQCNIVQHAHFRIYRILVVTVLQSWEGPLSKEASVLGVEVSEALDSVTDQEALSTSTQEFTPNWRPLRQEFTCTYIYRWLPSSSSKIPSIIVCPAFGVTEFPDVVVRRNIVGSIFTQIRMILLMEMRYKRARVKTLDSLISSLQIPRDTGIIILGDFGRAWEPSICFEREHNPYWVP